MSVYFILAPEVNRVKIGFTIDIQTRMYKLKNASPVELTLLYIIKDGGTETEHALHKRFGHLRVKHEWFDYSTGEIKAYLDMMPVYEKPKSRPHAIQLKLL